MGEGQVEFSVLVKTVSEANVRCHWATRARRAKHQRRAAYWTAREAIQGLKIAPPIRVDITRVGVRFLDSDNLAGACKGVRDGIADALRIDDGDERIQWTYAQAKGQARVEARIEWQT